MTKTRCAAVFHSAPFWFRIAALAAVLLAAAAVASPLAIAAAADKPNRPNVLFIAVDDLRPQLACYGQPQMKTPNFDALARSGTLFTRTYCQFSVCGASRASLLTGLRPTATRFRNFASRADHDAPGVVTLPEYFKKHGYYTLAMGKVFHNAEDSPQSWSEPHWSPPDSWPGYHNPATIAAAAKAHRRDKNIFGPPWENDDCPDEGYPDGRTAAHAIADLKRLKEKGQPFFLAVGFSKPHLPFTSPKKYWDLYDHAKIDLAKNPFAPKGAPAAALHQWRELRGNYSGIPQRPLLAGTIAEPDPRLLCLRQLCRRPGGQAAGGTRPARAERQYDRHRLGGQRLATGRARHVVQTMRVRHVDARAADRPRPGFKGGAPARRSRNWSTSIRRSATSPAWRNRPISKATASCRC